uniref:Reverse transcriptase/retrotransposon-derived protein RNase H-like domain-containing protein n=1 Tax=Stegastes partitus TaxID=144197 RepID=A0A3B5A7Q9_9TELE
SCKDGIRPNPSKVSAITELQPPDDAPGLWRFLGMLHYLGRYLPNLSEVIKPLNDLLKTDSVKQLISTAPTLAFYDVNKPTIVSIDASSFRLGGMLLQRHVKGLKPVAFCSRTLTDAEQRYAQIEKECLAVVWACERFSNYLYRLDSFTVHTDRKPLAPLINNKDLDVVPLRCQCLLMRLMSHYLQYRVKYQN